MATQQSNIPSSSGPKVDLADLDLTRLDAAVRSQEFRQLLRDYVAEVNDPAERARYEEEVRRVEREENGVDVVFLRPQPGYVLKTANLRTDEKVFVNVAVEPNVGRPEGDVRKADDGNNGVMWSIPQLLTEPRRDLDKSGRPCTVYDVMFHPETMSLVETAGARMKNLVTETALEAVERRFGLKLSRDNVRFPKMRVKGHFQRTVIRKPIQEEEEHKDSKVEEADEDDSLATPQHKVTYRQDATGDLPEARDASRSGGRVSDPCRPTHVAVEVSLPELTSTKDVDLDVTETAMALTSRDPGYRLRVRFAYPVAEEEATARFDVSTRKLTVCVPVRAAEVRRLTSTDSGIGVDGAIDTGYFACAEDNADSLKEGDDESNRSLEDDDEAVGGDVDDGSHKDGKVAADDDDVLFPPYSCNIYEDLMIFTLDVKRADAASVRKSAMDGEDFGFGLRFSSAVGRGLVPFHYAFYCAFVLPGGGAGVGDPADRVEVETWDNNIIVKVTLPRGMECDRYKVGSSARDLTIHNLPQLRALRKKKEKKMSKDPRESSPPDDAFVDSGPAPEDGHAPSSSSSSKRPPSPHPLPESDSKERHNSGDSEDSLLSGAPSSPSPDDDDHARFTVTPAHLQGGDQPQVARLPYAPVILPDGSRLRSILKSRKQRCFSESQAGEAASSDLMSWHSQASASTLEDVLDEEEEEDGAVASSKKSVRFNKVVQRQVFRPTSSITGLTAKNQKKKEQKRKRAERRASEGDAADDDGNDDVGDGCKKEEAACSTDSHNDSGVASSVDEGEGGGAGGAANKSGGRRRRKNKDKRANGSKAQTAAAAAVNDLIFDLDM